MPSAAAPRVTHFNDCAFVGRALVNAAHRAGLDWGYLPPELVRPEKGFTGGAGRLAQLPYAARHLRMLQRTDVVHVHYATAVQLLEHRYLPRRPYALHLHGTDIRQQWPAPATHAMIQRAIDGAAAVYYTNLDTIEQATAARPDAQYMPAFVEEELLPPWTPESETGPPMVLFVSRWDASKGVQTQLELARALRAALPASVRLVGLDWGPGADEAAAAGVELVPRLPHLEFLRLVARADAAVGQAAGILAVSELEAMAIGPALLYPASRLSDGGDPPPILNGTVAETVERCIQVLADPRAASDALGARSWVLNKHSPGRWIPVLEDVYRSAARG